MISKYILDTNVLIALLNNNKKAILHLVDLQQDHFSISVMSHFEFLVGATAKNILPEESERLLTLFEILPITPEVSMKAVELGKEFLQYKKKMLHKDLLIASTSIVYDKILITYDKEFKKMKHVDVHRLN